jgi:hypothetical protein
LPAAAPHFLAAAHLHSSHLQLSLQPSSQAQASHLQAALQSLQQAHSHLQSAHLQPSLQSPSLQGQVQSVHSQLAQQQALTSGAFSPQALPHAGPAIERPANNTNTIIRTNTVLLLIEVVLFTFCDSLFVDLDQSARNDLLQRSTEKTARPQGDRNFGMDKK